MPIMQSAAVPRMKCRLQVLPRLQQRRGHARDGARPLHAPRARLHDLDADIPPSTPTLSNSEDL